MRGRTRIGLPEPELPMPSVGACLFGTVSIALAVAFQGKPEATFEPPVRLKAGDAFNDPIRAVALTSLARPINPPAQAAYFA